MIIDCHVHYGNKKDYLERHLEVSQQLGIDKLCVSGIGPQYSTFGNPEVAEAIKKYPDQIIGFGYVGLGRDKADIVDRLYSEGFKGIKVISPLANYDDKSFYTIYERVEKLGLPILFHTGIVLRTPQDRELDISSARMRPIFLDTIARAFPTLNIIGAHLGNPWYAEACAVARQNTNVYFDLTGGGWQSVMTTADMKKLFFWKDAFEKVVFGTDTWVDGLEKAFNGYKRILEPLELPKNTMDNIYGKTLAKMLRISS